MPCAEIHRAALPCRRRGSRNPPRTAGNHTGFRFHQLPHLQGIRTILYALNRRCTVISRPKEDEERPAIWLNKFYKDSSAFQHQT